MKRRTVLGQMVLGAVATAALSTQKAKAEAMNASGALSTDPTETIPLWPGTPPGGEGVSLPNEIVERSTDINAFHDRFVHKVGTPLLTVFRPERPDGSAILMAPGGGYVREVLDKEGFETARYFNKAGITVFVLRYRLPAEGWKNGADVPLQDAQRALRLIRAHADHYGLDVKRIGVMGFSAGGHVAASLATRFAEKVYAPIDSADALDARPDFAGLMYPVITMSAAAHMGSRKALIGDAPSAETIAHYSCEMRVAADTAPSFIAFAQDDTAVPPIGNSVAMYLSLANAKVPVEMHAFQEGGHGFGIRQAQGKTCAAWPELFLTWARRGGWVKG
ncbi:acetyl esterase/lipase [Rhizomicrobium palustre]|uniref:Acetyl esterase/lipase n=1 Tax=Rhizomicrobium palustre TaxID=189966 RepID=A0A846N138_9PROT|nr:alpha/beta hydrolase [Rhizomicrobium palustre]NIK88870.1 acetyl esterase/lipase [Rhizomicrobium palustre]